MQNVEASVFAKTAGIHVPKKNATAMLWTASLRLSKGAARRAERGGLQWLGAIIC